MKENLKLLISSVMMILTSASPQATHGTENFYFSQPEEHKKQSGIQLSKGANDTLEAVLGVGNNNVMLKMSMNLKTLEKPLDKERAEVPAQLFLAGSSINHPAVDFKVKVDCSESLPLKCVLPDKPQTFDSYKQFTDWLNQGYFTNEIRITYDFHVDAWQLAPSLVQHLFSVSPDYHFIGTHAIDNGVIKPNRCVPEITYSSQRGKANETTATMGGIFYLNDSPYPIEDTYQAFPHAVIDETVVKRKGTKKFYSHKRLKYDVITKVTYEEFPGNQAHNWPNIPSETYTLLGQNPDYLEEIDHLACLDGRSGEKVDISDGRVFLIVSEDINKAIEGSRFLESIVKDDAENLYIVRYRHQVSVPSWLKSEDKAVYQQFVNGALIYKPNPNSDEGKIVLPIADLANPLEGTFDLSKCGDTGNYLSISTGYRKGEKPENKSKYEIWFAPRFLIEKELNTTAKHFQAIFPAKWNANAPVGIFWTWGGWDDLSYMDYLTTENMDNLSKIDLYENWKKSTLAWERACGRGSAQLSCFICDLK